MYVFTNIFVSTYLISDLLDLELDIEFNNGKYIIRILQILTIFTSFRCTYLLIIVQK